MNMKLADGLTLPGDEAVTQKYGFIGRSGSGKSYAAMKLAELFLDRGAQVIALDWVGIWWSLRLAADGRSPHFSNVYIFGGEHADVPLQPESGALMADLVVDQHISVVLDVMHFRKAERTRFATAFAEQFFHRKKTARTACHLFIEEAQAYLPQFVRGDDARMVGVFEDIGKVGRNYGIGTSLISQRPQAINKDVLNQVEVLLAFQTNGPQERKAIAGWTAENTDAGATMIQALPTLRVGSAIVWSPQWLRIAKTINIDARQTYDASSTPSHKAKTIRPKTLGKADLEKLGAQMAATMEKAKADDPAMLKKRIQEYERQIKQAKPEKVQVNAKSLLTDKDRLLLEQVWSRLDRVLDGSEGRIALFVEKITKVCHEEQESLKKIVDGKRLKVILQKVDGLTQTPLPIVMGDNVLAKGKDYIARKPGVVVTKRSMSVFAPPKEQTNYITKNGDGELSPGEEKILRAVLQFKAIDRSRLSVLVGYKKTSRDTYIGRLSAKGLIVIESGQLRPTAAGLAAMNGSFDPLPTGSKLIEYWRARLPEGERVILDALIAVDGSTVTRSDVAEHTAYKKTSRDTYLGRLKARGLVEFTGQGMVRASPELFAD